MIGINTTFYGYRGDIVEKTRKLISIFESLDVSPYIQISSSSVNERFESTVAKLNSLRDKHGVRYGIHQSIWLPSPDFFLNLGSSNKAVMEGTLDSLKRSIDFARKIGAKNVSFHGGYAANKVVQSKEFEPLAIFDEISYEEAYSNVEESLKKILSYAGKSVKLSIENFNYRPERRYLYSTPEDFRRLPKGVNVLFDTGHAYFSETRLKDPSYIEKMIEVVGGKITDIHASDNDGSEDQHKLVGLGRVPFSKIFKLITKKQKLPPVIIEASQAKHGYSESDLKRSIEVLAQLIKKI